MSLSSSTVTTKTDQKDDKNSTNTSTDSLSQVLFECQYCLTQLSQLFIDRKKTAQNITALKNACGFAEFIHDKLKNITTTCSEKQKEVELYTLAANLFDRFFKLELWEHPEYNPNNKSKLTIKLPSSETFSSPKGKIFLAIALLNATEIGLDWGGTNREHAKLLLSAATSLLKAAGTQLSEKKEASQEWQYFIELQQHNLKNCEELKHRINSIETTLTQRSSSSVFTPLKATGPQPIFDARFATELKQINELLLNFEDPRYSQDEKTQNTLAEKFSSLVIFYLKLKRVYLAQFYFFACQEFDKSKKYTAEYFSQKAEQAKEVFGATFTEIKPSQSSLYFKRSQKLQTLLNNASQAVADNNVDKAIRFFCEANTEEYQEFRDRIFHTLGLVYIKQELFIEAFDALHHARRYDRTNFHPILYSAILKNQMAIRCEALGFLALARFFQTKAHTDALSAQQLNLQFVSRLSTTQPSKTIKSLLAPFDADEEKALITIINKKFDAKPTTAPKTTTSPAKKTSDGKDEKDDKKNDSSPTQTTSSVNGNSIHYTDLSTKEKLDLCEKLFADSAEVLWPKNNDFQPINNIYVAAKTGKILRILATITTTETSEDEQRLKIMRVMASCFEAYLKVYCTDEINKDNAPISFDTREMKSEQLKCSFLTALLTAAWAAIKIGGITLRNNANFLLDESVKLINKIQSKAMAVQFTKECKDLKEQIKECETKLTTGMNQSEFAVLRQKGPQKLLETKTESKTTTTVETKADQKTSPDTASINPEKLWAGLNKALLEFTRDPNNQDTILQLAKNLCDLAQRFIDIKAIHFAARFFKEAKNHDNSLKVKRFKFLDNETITNFNRLFKQPIISNENSNIGQVNILFTELSGYVEAKDLEEDKLIMTFYEIAKICPDSLKSVLYYEFGKVCLRKELYVTAFEAFSEASHWHATNILAFNNLAKLFDHFAKQFKDANLNGIKILFQLIASKQADETLQILANHTGNVLTQNEKDELARIKEEGDKITFSDKSNKKNKPKKTKPGKSESTPKSEGPKKSESPKKTSEEKPKKPEQKNDVNFQKFHSWQNQLETYASNQNYSNGLALIHKALSDLKKIVSSDETTNQTINKFVSIFKQYQNDFTTMKIKQEINPLLEAAEKLVPSNFKFETMEVAKQKDQLKILDQAKQKYQEALKLLNEFELSDNGIVQTSKVRLETVQKTIKQLTNQLITNLVKQAESLYAQSETIPNKVADPLFMDACFYAHGLGGESTLTSEAILKIKGGTQQKARDAKQHALEEQKRAAEKAAAKKLAEQKAQAEAARIAAEEKALAEKRAREQEKARQAAEEKAHKTAAEYNSIAALLDEADKVKNSLPISHAAFKTADAKYQEAKKNCQLTQDVFGKRITEGTTWALSCLHTAESILQAIADITSNETKTDTNSQTESKENATNPAVQALLARVIIGEFKHETIANSAGCRKAIGKILSTKRHPGLEALFKIPELWSAVFPELGHILTNKEKADIFTEINRHVGSFEIVSAVLLAATKTPEEDNSGLRSQSVTHREKTLTSKLLEACDPKPTDNSWLNRMRVLFRFTDNDLLKPIFKLLPLKEKEQKTASNASVVPQLQQFGSVIHGAYAQQIVGQQQQQLASTQSTDAITSTAAQPAPKTNGL